MCIRDSSYIEENKKRDGVEKYPNIRKLVITGGCALNKQANDKVKGDWKNLYVPKNPGDPGSCIGAVLALESKHIDFDQQVWYNK